MINCESTLPGLEIESQRIFGKIILMCSVAVTKSLTTLGSEFEILGGESSPLTAL